MEGAKGAGAAVPMVADVVIPSSSSDSAAVGEGAAASARQTSASGGATAPTKSPALPFCPRFARGYKCNEQECNAPHIPKEERPTCPVWLANGNCVFGDKCWAPHALPPHLRSPHPHVTVIFQTHASHAGRVLDVLRDECEFSGGSTAILAHGKAHGMNRKADHVILLSTGTTGSGSGMAWIRDFATRNGFLGNTITRAYAIDRMASSWEEVLSYFKERVLAASRAVVTAPAGDEGAAAAPSAVPVRTYGYPNILETRLSDDLLSRGSPLRASLSRWDVLFSVVDFAGFWYIGSAERASAALWSSLAQSHDAEADRIICRAQYKLVEVMQRTGKLRRSALEPGGPAEESFALDVGAAPGGWSCCLAEDCGYSRVFAVDPSPLSSSPSRPLPSAIEHIQMKGEQAVDVLLARGLAGRISAFTSDMNVPTFCALEVFESSRPLLCDGCSVVITLKNFDGGADWSAAVRSTVARFCLSCSDVEVIHLTANGPREVTCLGTYRASPSSGSGGDGASASASLLLLPSEEEVRQVADKAAELAFFATRKWRKAPDGEMEKGTGKGKEA
jgi:hypothetical protein